MHPQFMSNRMTNFEQIKDAVDSLINSITDDEVVDLQPLFFRLTFETTLFLLFGQHLSSLKSQGITGRESDFAGAFNVRQDYLTHVEGLVIFGGFGAAESLRTLVRFDMSLWMVPCRRRWSIQLQQDQTVRIRVMKQRPVPMSSSMHLSSKREIQAPRQLNA
ncbi:hypothetical protein BDW69DRAFT_73947 [Aspergillus filifer]